MAVSHKADVVIINQALTLAKQGSTVMSDDTDAFALLVHFDYAENFSAWS